MSSATYNGNHPIPDTDVLDVITTKKGGGADLGLIIASPMAGDEYSLERLLTKIEGYLGYVQSVEFRQQCGSPSVANTAIVVHVHSGSDESVFDLLSRSHAWVNSNAASLVVVPIEDAPVLN